MSAALLIAAFASPAVAVAETGEEAVVRPVATPPWIALSYWTQARLEEAQPLPIVTLPGPPAPEASTAALGGVEARAASVEGVKVESTESDLYPNRSIGKVLGGFMVHGRLQGYECSGSVIHSTSGDVVLTAGHCAVNPETGAMAKYLIFIPAYYEDSKPPYGTYGMWAASSVVTTPSWKVAESSSVSLNEGEDLAFLKILDNFEGESIEEAVGSLEVNFNQACNQAYTQYGYPAEGPYDGEVLYSHSAPYVGSDTNPFVTPKPIKIASDFTRGASGGPWTVGSSGSPTVLSLTAYGYADQPGYLYGPYFGEAARRAYNLAAEAAVPIGIEESCAAPSPPPPAPTPTPPAPSSPAPEAAPPTKAVTLKVTRVRHRANGSAVLMAKVSAAGMLKLSGAAVRPETLDTPAAGRYRLVVAPKGLTNRRLRTKGRAKVGVKVVFRASGKTKRVSRAVELSRRAAARHARRSAHRRS